MLFTKTLIKIVYCHRYMWYSNYKFVTRNSDLNSLYKKHKINEFNMRFYKGYVKHKKYEIQFYCVDFMTKKI